MSMPIVLAHLHSASVSLSDALKWYDREIGCRGASTRSREVTSEIKALTTRLDELRKELAEYRGILGSRSIASPVYSTRNRGR